MDKTESAKEITVPTKKEVENYNKQENSLAVLLGIEKYKMAKNNLEQDVIRNAYQEEQAKLT